MPNIIISIINIKTLSSLFYILFSYSPSEIWPVSAWTRHFQVPNSHAWTWISHWTVQVLTLNVEVKEYDQQISQLKTSRVHMWAGRRLSLQRQPEAPGQSRAVPDESLPQCSGNAHPTFGMSILSTHQLGPPEENHLSFGFLSCMRAKLPQSCLTLCNPMDCSPPGSSVHGILQARIVEWVAVSSSRGSFWPWDRTYVSCVSCTGRWVLCHWRLLGFCFLVWNMEGLKFSEVPFVTDVPSFSELLLGSTLWGSQPLTLGSIWVLLSLPLVLVISWQEAGRLGNGYGAAHSTQKRLLPLGQWVGSLASWSSIVNLMQQKMKEVNSLLRIPRDCEGN